MRSATYRIALCAVILWTGCWRGGLSCNENKKNCDQMMDNALTLPTAEARCSGIRNFVACVQEDIQDCTDNRITDQYALNLQAMHCNEAYLCAERLRACYSKFTWSKRKTITQSDYITRMDICRTLLTEIMTCQENVTSECQGQTGLTGTVSRYQATLNLVCNNTDPCVSLVLQCQQSSEEKYMRNGKGDAGENNQQGDQPELLSNCEAQKPVDYCGAYRQTAACIRMGVAACESHVDVNSTLVNLDNSIKEICDPVSTCSQGVSSCLCHVNKHSHSPVSILTNICTAYPPFEGCLDGLGSECKLHSEVSKEVKGLKDAYRKYYVRYCTLRDGLCPQTVECLVKLPHGAAQSSSSSSSDDPDIYSTLLHLNTLCSGGSPFFDCLETSSAQCQKKDGDVVTFSMIEDHFLELCADTAAHVMTLQQCPTFTQCLREFGELELGIRKEEDEHDYIRQMFLGTTTTNFWCQYLTHAADCVRKTGGPEACGVGDQLIAVSIQRTRDLQTLCRGPTTTPAPKQPKTPKPAVTSAPTKDGNHGTSLFQSSHHRTLLLALTLAVIHSLSLALH